VPKLLDKAIQVVMATMALMLLGRPAEVVVAQVRQAAPVLLCT
jgi:hypothetical protein